MVKKVAMMRITVMGAGALGGYFGARLAAAGHEVTLVARGAHLAALRQNGLRVISPLGDLHLPDIRAVADPGESDTADVILFMVKNYDVEDAAQAIAPIVGSDTMVVTCQNGVSAPERLGQIIGADRVVPGVARIPGHIAEPGVIRHTAPFDRLMFGEMGGGVSDRCRRFYDALKDAGTAPELSENIAAELWVKLVMQATLASMTTLLRLDIGPIRDAPETWRLFCRGVQETAEVARAAVAGIPDDVVKDVRAFVEAMPDHVHASMLDDLRNGKPLEVDYLSGDVVTTGRKFGVPTPLHEVFWAALQPFKMGGAPVVA
jgi:2-dehydropantoate 2-reductase